MRLLNVEAAAEMLSISKWTVRAYIRSGKLRPVRLGRRVLLAEVELERFIAENQDHPPLPDGHKGDTPEEAAQ
jgi:excisionase family DNA binding protein